MNVEKGEEKMRNYDIMIKIPEGRIKEIMDKMNNAQETFYECYDELISLGVVAIEKTPSNKVQQPLFLLSERVLVY